VLQASFSYNFSTPGEHEVEVTVVAYFNSSTNSTHNNNSTKNSLAIRKTKVCRVQPMLWFVFGRIEDFEDPGSFQPNEKLKVPLHTFSSKFQYSVRSIEKL
jgi:hypothetical protein